MNQISQPVLIAELKLQSQPMFAIITYGLGMSVLVPWLTTSKRENDKPKSCQKSWKKQLRRLKHL